MTTSNELRQNVVTGRWTVVAPRRGQRPLAAVAHELWIVPRRHHSGLGEARESERGSLARMLGELLGRLRRWAGDPPYNLMIESPGVGHPHSSAFHWFARIRPRSAQLAGFELASGVMINASSPEADALVLRGETFRDGAR